jgi:hypothetical protein
LVVDLNPWCGVEALANVLLGRIDATTCGSDHEHWLYPLLSMGYKLALVGGSARPIGWSRTYVRLEPGESLSYGRWIDAIRKGRTTVSRGPLLSLSVNDELPGSEIQLSERDSMITIRAEAQARDRFDRIELVHDGNVIHTASASLDGTYRAEVEMSCRIMHSGWVSARCVAIGPGISEFPVVAHTSAVYLKVDGRPPVADPQFSQAIAAHLDEALAWVQNEARCETPKQRERLANIFLQAKQKLLS